MTRLLVAASLILVANLVTTPIVYGHGPMKKNMDKGREMGFEHIDPPYDGD